MKLTPQTKEAARKLVTLWDNGSIKQKIWLIAVRGKTLTDGSWLPYVVGEGASEDFDIPMECLEELHHVKLIVLEERSKTDSKLSKTRGLQINERRVGWNILLLEELKEIVRNDFQSTNGGNTKLKYRHLSEGAKSLAKKLVSHNKNGEIGWQVEFLEFTTGDIMRKNSNDNINISLPEVRYFKELEAFGLLQIYKIPEGFGIKLTKKLLDAVESDFSELETEISPQTQVNINSPVFGSFGLNTGSGVFQQSQNIQIHFQELRKILEDLGYQNDLELNELVEQAENEPSDENRFRLAARLLNKGISTLSDYGGAASAVQLAMQFLHGVSRLL